MVNVGVQLDCFVDLQGFDEVGQIGLGGVKGRGAGSRFRLGGGDGVFRFVQVVDEAVAGRLVGVLEGADVGALTVPVAAEIGEAAVDLVDGDLGIDGVASRCLSPRCRRAVWPAGTSSRKRYTVAVVSVAGCSESGS